VNWLIVVLRLLHIGAGVFWAGAVFTVARFVLPAAAAAGEEGQRFARRLMLQQKLTAAMIGSGVVTVLAGLWLFHIDSGGHEGAFVKSGMGAMLGIGALAALSALGTGIRSAVQAATLGKLAAAVEAKGGAPAPEQVRELQALGAGLARRARSVAIQLGIAVLCMAVARYVVF